MRKTFVSVFVACAALAGAPDARFLRVGVVVAQAQSPVDLGTISRIKQEALTNSQVMDHVGWMSDVYGPRLTGTPQMEEASKWAMKRFTEWGLANVHQERFAFGQGWKVERFSAHLVEPQVQPIIGFPRTYSPSTKGAVTADVVRVDIRTEADLARYAGKLRGKIVLPQDRLDRSRLNLSSLVVESRSPKITSTVSFARYSTMRLPISTVFSMGKSSTPLIVVFFAFIRSPVRGLRTQRASRTRFSNEPNPVMATFSPRATSRAAGSCSRR